MKKTDQAIIDDVINWFEKAVLGLNLCPFAAKPYEQGAICFELSQAINDESCLIDLFLNLQKLDEEPDVETLVLICPSHFTSFADYNQFLSLTDDLLIQQGWEGVYQIASFHPGYIFAECDADDQANWTNRSPYPIFHLIRETSINKAVKFHPDVDAIPQRNAELLRSLSKNELTELFSADKKIPGKPGI